MTTGTRDSRLQVRGVPASNPGVLLVATSSKPATFAHDLAHGRCPRIDYLEASRALNGTAIDYDSLAPNRTLRRVEEALRLDLRLATYARALVRRHRFQVVVSMSERVGIPLALLLDRSVRHIVLPCHMLSRTKLFVSRLARIPSRWNTVLALTEAEAAVLRQLPGHREVKVLPRWVDTHFFTPTAAGPDGDGDCVLSVGLSYRDYPTLLQAMASVPDIPCRIRAGSSWVVAGAGQSRTPSNVQVTGTVRPDVLRADYRRSRLVIVPIRSTTQWTAGATAVLEAQAMGKAVIATRTPGMAEYVRHGETGLLVEPHDPAALASAVATLWNDPEAARAMGERACAWVREHLSLERWLDQLQATVAQG